MLTKKQYIVLQEFDGDTIGDDYCICRIVSDEVFFNAYKRYDDSNNCVLQRNSTPEGDFSNRIDHVTNILSTGREYVNGRDGKNFGHLINIESIHCIEGYLYLLYSGLLIPIDDHFNMVKMPGLRPTIQK